MESLKSEFFFSSSINDLNQLEWNACIQDDHPFISYEFLSALEAFQIKSAPFFFI